MKEFALMAFVQFVSYFNLTLNFRAIAHGHIAYAMMTDAVAVAMSYIIVRKVVKTESWWTLVGMMAGGSLAAGAGIWLTRTWG